MVTCSPVNNKESASIQGISSSPPSGPQAVLGETLLSRPYGLVCIWLSLGQSPPCCSQDCFVSKEWALSTSWAPSFHELCRWAQREEVKSPALRREGLRNTFSPWRICTEPLTWQKGVQYSGNAVSPQARALWARSQFLSLTLHDVLSSWSPQPL